MPRTHQLDAAQVHYEWNNALRPRLGIEPGDTVVFDTRDAADGYYTPASTHADVLARGPFRGHPLTGPVAVRGARPGDTLVVDVLEVRPRAPFGWTQIRPGRGLLPEADFPKPYLQLWDLSDGAFARMAPNVAVPIEAFPGVMGTALPEPGGHSTMPPRKNGGNMDVKHLVAGATLFLPVWVPEALFSVGDGHAAQGDGEVCVTAVEMAARVTLRFGLRTGGRLPEPRFRTPGPLAPGVSRGPFFVTTAHGPDLYAAAQQAVRYMIDHLGAERGLAREQAYVLASVAVDLKISEVVDAPNWIVSAFLPECIFG
jgi:acetamidase/formamidase